MPNRNGDANGSGRNGNLLDHLMHWDSRLWQNNFRHRREWLSLQGIRQRSRFHFGCNVDVMRGTRFGKILAVFRERGQSRDRKQQQYRRRNS